VAEEFDNNQSTRSAIILTPGAVISHYKIVSKLGVGGMGEVFLADDLTLRRRAALKFLAPNLAVDESLRQRFIREAQSAAALNHPNIITIYEVAEVAERVFIAMEYVEGRTLREIIDARELTLDKAVQFALQICDGLHAAHSKGYVHRDIKPLNIILDTDKRVRILDFGLAKAIGDVQLTQAGSLMGTAQYMSPEQGQGIDTDHRSDIFSMGIVLYEMLTGTLPFKKPNIPAYIYAIVNEEPPPMSQYVPSIPSQFQAIVSRAMAKSVLSRYQTVAEMASDLKKAVGLESSISSMSVASAMTSPPSPEPSSVVESMHSRIPAGTMSPSQPVTKALAVLHLRNLGSPDDDFLSYGITEDLIVDLTRIGTMRISPMRSIMKFKDADTDIAEIASKLNVSYVLDGSIHKSTKAIRVSAQLIDVSDGANLWAERWEEPLENLSKIKRALAEGISQAFNISSTIVRVAHVGMPEAEDAQAYEQYLKGKYIFEKKKDKADVVNALSLYRKALAKEPALVAARAGIIEILMHQGQFKEAQMELESALEEAASKGLRAEKASLLRLLAKLHIHHSDWEKAWLTGNESLTITQELKDLSGEAETLGVLISALQPQAKFDEALPLFDRVLEISRRLDDQEKIADALKNMGILYSRKGDYSRALDLYNESLELATASENLSLQAACLSNIGNVNYFKGDLDSALRFYGKAMAINDRLGDKAGTARQGLNMGLVQLQRGNHREGLELLNVSSTFFEALGDKANFALTLTNISQLRLTLGDAQEALKSAEQALSLAQEINHPLAESAAHHRLGAIHIYQQDYDSASTHLHKALEIAKTAKINRNVGALQVELAELHYFRNEFAFSRKHAERSQMIAREIGDSGTLCLAQGYIGLLTASEGLIHAGVRQLQQQQAKAKEIGDPILSMRINIIAGEALFRFGKEDDKVSGRTLLNSILAEARKSELFPETKRILGILESEKP